MYVAATRQSDVSVRRLAVCRLSWERPLWLWMAVGMLLKLGRVVCGDIGAVADFLVVLFVVIVGLLPNYWPCLW